MRTASTVILLASLAVLASSVVAAQSDTASVQPGDTMATSGSDVVMGSPQRVLFIGNSHTHTNGGIDLHVGRMAKADEPSLEFTGVAATVSGATLAEHYELDSQGRIPEGDFDIVVLQGHIPRSEDSSAASFMEYARKLDAVAERYGAETVFFMSWAHVDFESVKLKDITRAHRRIATELDAKVAPVARAMQRVRRERPDLPMLSGDGVHASWAGSYLASAVIYATLFERSPEGNGYTFGVSAVDAAYLQRVAWGTVTDWNEALADPG